MCVQVVLVSVTECPAESPCFDVSELIRMGEVQMEMKCSHAYFLELSDT